MIAKTIPKKIAPKSSTFLPASKPRPTKKKPKMFRDDFGFDDPAPRK